MQQSPSFGAKYERANHQGYEHCEVGHDGNFQREAPRVGSREVDDEDHECDGRGNKGDDTKSLPYGIGPERPYIHADAPSCAPLTLTTIMPPIPLHFSKWHVASGVEKPFR